MKILVCGKGGSGKSTISALLAKSLAKNGHDVLVIDGDESNFGLYKQLGIEPPKEFMTYFGGKKEVVKKLISAITEKKPVKLFEKSLKIEDIPREYLSGEGKVKLLVIGKIKEFNEGCACPMGALLRELLKNFEFNGFIIVDTEAGVEHFGRGVVEGCDIVLFIIDPTFESLMLSKKVEEMVKDAEGKIYFILNKVDNESKNILLSNIDSKKVITIVPFRREIFESSLIGKEIDISIPEIDAVVDFLISKRNL